MNVQEEFTYWFTEFTKLILCSKNSKFSNFMMLYSSKIVSFMKQLTKSFLQSKHCGDNHNYHARAATKKLPDISHFNADNGTQSAKCHCIIHWNSFLKNAQFIRKRATHSKKSNQSWRNLDNSLEKKWSFPLRIS